jgi:CBS domain-containing protein
MKIKEVMAKPVFVLPDATKEELFAIAKKHPGTRLFLVVDKDQKFLGDINEDDLFLMVLPNDLYDEIGVELGFDLQKKFFATKASELMRRHDSFCQEDEEIMTVALRLAGEEVNEIPVLSKAGKVVGVITEGMLLRKIELR